MSALRMILEGKAERTVHYVGPNATVRDAVAKMCQKHVGALLVEENEQPIGIVSERDIMVRLVLEHRDPATTRVSVIMTKDVFCIGPDEEPERVMALMTQRRVRHLPVVEGRRVVGLVSIGDLVRWVSRNQDFEIRALRDYVCGVYPG
jgi:CBS domain-containing protein